MIAIKSTAAALALVVVFTSFTSFALSETKPTPKDTAADNSTLASLLKREGFGVVKLKRRTSTETQNVSSLMSKLIG